MRALALVLVTINLQLVHVLTVMALIAVLQDIFLNLMIILRLMLLLLLLILKVFILITSVRRGVVQIHLF